MPAFILASVDVRDAERFSPYREAVSPIVAQFGGHYLSRGGAIHASEGDLGFGRLTIITFPSLDAARALYNSPEYAPWRALREATTRSKVAFLESGSLPTAT